MKIADARTLSQDAQESLRMRAVKAVIEDGKTQVETAKTFGVGRVIVGRWIARYRREGQEALLKKKRGRRSSDMRLLKPHQCATVVRMITDNCPDQLKLPFALWTREAVSDLIERKWGVKLSVRSVGKIDSCSLSGKQFLRGVPVTALSRSNIPPAFAKASSDKSSSDRTFTAPHPAKHLSANASLLKPVLSSPSFKMIGLSPRNPDST